MPGFYGIAIPVIAIPVPVHVYTRVHVYGSHGHGWVFCMLLKIAAIVNIAILQIPVVLLYRYGHTRLERDGIQ